MDLTRVFGGPQGSFDSVSADSLGFRASSSGGYGGPSAQAHAQIPPHKAFRQANDAIVALQRESQGYEAITNKLVSQIHSLQRAVEAAQGAYQSVAAEKEHFNLLLSSAEGRLAEVQRVVQRYTVVQEPVVASDGFTYEKKIIKQYLDECARSGVSPVSQQTQSELTATLIPNQSLKKLVELLKTAKPNSSESPQSPVNASQSGKVEASAQGGNKGQQQGGDGRLHPCVRVYGYCNYKDTCTYAQYPYDACLSHLKGKCRFGSQCHELHVDFRGPTGGAQGSRRKD